MKSMLGLFAAKPRLVKRCSSRSFSRQVHLHAQATLESFVLETSTGVWEAMLGSFAA